MLSQDLFGLQNNQSFGIIADYDVDLNSILSKCDYLITDYSGVVFDYLYLNRPIIFYVPDYDEFKRNNGFEVNVIEKNIGQIAKNIDELGTIISELSKNNSENFIKLQNMEILRKKIFNPSNNGIENIIKIIERT